MKTNVNLWWLLTAFFLLMAVIYTGWNIIDKTSATVAWYHAVEWVGTIAMLFVAFMSALIAFYVGRVYKSQGAELPEDTLTADIDDADPEMGEFSPWSWWPLLLAFSAALAMIGLSVGSWMVPIGLGVFLVAIVGWVYEYYRGYFAR